jgi:hypothetical protein
MRISFIIVIISLIVLGVGFWYWQEGRFSKELVKLEILAPDKIKLGQEIEYLVKFKNQGEINLEDAKLTFEYPSYSLLSQNQKLRQEISLETIYPGQEKTISFKARLFGKEGEAKIAKTWLSYRPKNLKSFFESATTKTTIISSVPFTLDIDIPSKIVAGKEIHFYLNYFSNVDYPLANLRVLIEYPSDFEFQRAKPFSLEKNEWQIPLLNKAEGGRIEIVGKFFGEIDQNKIIEAKAGIWQDNTFILLAKAVKGIAIISPRLFISQKINGKTDYSAFPGDILHYEIFFKNIGEDPLTDLFLIIKLEGKAFNFQTLKSPGGIFKAGDNSIVFDGRTIPQLSFLDSKEEGRIEFWIELLDDWQIGGLADKNHFIKTIIFLSQAKEIFITKINSKIEISQKAFFEDQIFGNIGPHPPKENQTTTYTIIWQAKNYFNDLIDVKVKAKLAENVELTGEIFPEKAKLTFDSQSKEIVWDIGKTPTGTGIITPPFTLAFQVALTPESSQESYPLISQAVITGQDVWTGNNLESQSPGLDTILLTEIEINKSF